MAIPTYCQDDPALARVVDEAAADVFLPGIGDQTGGRAAAAGLSGTAGGRSGCHVLEVAAVKARSRSPLVAVAERNRPLIGAITLDSMLDRLLGT
jgi:hypothetical protein